MRFYKFLTVLLTALWLVPTGCIITTGDDDDEEDSDTTTGNGIVFKADWTVEDEGGTAVTCAEAGAVYVRTTIVDSSNTSFEFYAFCENGAYELETDQPIEDGTASVTIDLITENEDVLSTTEAFSFDIDASADNDFDTIAFVVALWDPFTGADATLNWEWRKATGATWSDPYADTEPFTSSYCEEMGIDYVALYIWNPEANKWWTDSTLTDIRCDSYDHDNDNDYTWGADAYSGLHVNDFLKAGTYKMHLGFYRKKQGEEKSDMLLYWDSAGMDGDSLDGVLATDNPADDGTNLWLTVFDSDEEAVEFGVLKIQLKWLQSQGTAYDSCDDSTVTEMGFLLRSDGWIAAQVELGNGLDCLDWLNFEEVPVLESDYELLVSGISDDDTFLWHHLCEGLVPEVGVTLDTATGYVCEIDNQLDD